MKNRIITLIDFSEHSENLVKVCFDFSRILRAPVMLLHKVPGAVPAMTEIEVKQQIIDLEKEEALLNLKDYSANHQPYDLVEFKVSEKNILPLLEEIKDEQFYDWVFVGLKVSGFLKKVLIGSTPTKIIDSTNLLTLGIPLQNLVPKPPKKLVIAVHYKFPVNLKDLDIVLTSLSDQITEIEFMSVITKNDEEILTTSYLQELKKNYSIYSSGMTFFKGSDAFSEIKNYLDNKIDTYLVVQQGSRTLQDSVFRKFMINELIYGASLPIIVIPQ